LESFSTNAVSPRSSSSRRSLTITRASLPRRYQLQKLALSIASFEKSLAITDPSVKPTLPDPTAPLPELTPAQIILADTHTNLGAAYILSKPPRPEKALEHLQKALMINPDDGEVRQPFTGQGELLAPKCVTPDEASADDTDESTPDSRFVTIWQQS
jgi:tetratricopeptide (TPR) repeat protein